MELTTETMNCMECSHFNECPIIIAWVEACEQPMEVLTFYCSEFERRV